MKAVFTLAGAVFCAVFAFALTYSPVFKRGTRYEFYLGNSSSAEIICSDYPVLDKLLHADIKGESVRYAGDLYEQLKEEFSAELLFTEEVAGVVNYYLHSPLLGKGIALSGYVVNLHIAVSEGQTAAGTPLIFGGF